MRLKVAPEDFRVRETLDFVVDRDGPFYVHRLRKAKLDTLEAIGLIAAEAGIERDRIAFAGLKDRQGVTEQWISIEGGRVDLDTPRLAVRFVGRSAEPVTSKLSRGNEFRIVVRDMGRGEVERLHRNAAGIERDGFANYFDDQRFNCLRHGQGFVMKDVLRGRFEAALRALIARPSRAALGGDVRLKRLLRDHFGDWERCGRIARGPVWSRLFRHLQDHPTDFRTALELLPARVRLIHAFAWQSFLWNRAVDLLLKRELPAYARLVVATRPGDLVTWRKLRADLARRFRSIETPLWAPGSKGGDPTFRSATERVVQDAGLSGVELVNDVPGMVLREEPRQLLVVPRQFEIGAPERDELHRGRHKAVLRFGLPRGSYATMLIKHLFADAVPVRRGEPRRRVDDA